MKTISNPFTFFAHTYQESEAKGQLLLKLTSQNSFTGLYSYSNRYPPGLLCEAEIKALLEIILEGRACGICQKKNSARSNLLNKSNKTDTNASINSW